MLLEAESEGVFLKSEGVFSLNCHPNGSLKVFFWRGLTGYPSMGGGGCGY